LEVGVTRLRATLATPSAAIDRWISVWPPVSPTVLVRRPRAQLPFPLSHSGCRVYLRARHGLWQALRAHELEAGDEVLVPEFHHGSEVEALLRAGLQVRFYRCDDGLEPNPEHLTSLLGERVRILYLIHYLGFPQDAARWRRWADEHGLLLVEDAAQAWLAERDGAPIGSVGDVAIFCLYKTLGLADGGAVISTRPIAPAAGPRPLGLRSLQTGAERWLRQRFDVVRTLGRFSYRPFDPERDPLELGDPTAPHSRAAEFVIARQADTMVAAARRANYRVLLQELPDLVAPAFAQLPDGASPLQYPIDVDDKTGVLARLAGAGVEGANVWSRPHPLAAADESAATRALRSRLVGLPVHQGLGDAELARIVRAARAAVTA
jgi:hypothetical protein